MGTFRACFVYKEMCIATDYKTKSIEERCTTLAPKRTPLVIENKSLGHRWLRRENQHIDNDDLIVFRHKLDIMKRYKFLWKPYTATVMSLLPSICLVGSVAWWRWYHSFVFMLSDTNPIECCDNLECNNLFLRVLRNH
ncbi:hypothetical protein GmHk_14G041820 [Glycine max]|nr:hypothetical protein GmHk_14G041820 [Glycine max]